MCFRMRALSAKSDREDVHVAGITAVYSIVPLHDDGVAKRQITRSIRRYDIGLCLTVRGACI
jgi:hypothetical protein